MQGARLMRAKAIVLYEAVSYMNLEEEMHHKYQY